MEEQEYSRFSQALSALALVFSDEMSELRTRIYFAVLAPEMTIEEWEAACLHALKTETFHKVPLPAVFLNYPEPKMKRDLAAYAQHIKERTNGRFRTAELLTDSDDDE